MERFSQKPFHVIAKPIGPSCNLNCRYCFYLDKAELFGSKKGFRMPLNVLEAFIKSTIEAQPTQSVGFVWQGGEPTLLGLDFFKTALALQKRYALGKRIENALQTNGVLLNDDWCAFLAQNGFLVGISVDGPRKFHDAYRTFKGGQPSFQAIIRTLRLLKKHGVDYNTLCCVHRANQDFPLEVYDFLRAEGSGYIQFIPVVERMPVVKGLESERPSQKGPDRDAFVAPFSVEPLAFGRFLCRIFDEWVQRDLQRVFVQHFDTALESWVGLEPSLCLFRKTCGDALAIEHNGDLYSCDHFVFPEHRLGNILKTPLPSLALGTKQRAFGLDKLITLPSCCQTCEVRFACNGECPKNRFTLSVGGEPGLNYLCEGYRMFFNHIDPFMRFMANELHRGRAPANVMTWARARLAKGASVQNLNHET